MDTSIGSRKLHLRGAPRRRTALRRARTTGLIVAAVATPLLLSACAANFSAQTQAQYQPAVGTSNREGSVYVLNALVVANNDGDGTIVTSMVNQASATDWLVDYVAKDLQGGGIETSKIPPTPASASGDAHVPPNGIELASHQATIFPGPAGSSAGTPPASLINAKDGGALQLHADAVKPGTFLTLTFNFQSAGPVTMDVPVVPESNVYTGVTVGPIPTPASAGPTTATETSTP